MSFTDDILKKRADRAEQVAAMLGAIGGSFSQMGVRRVELADGTALDLEPEDEREFVDIPFDCNVLAFDAPNIMRSGKNPWNEWREADMEFHLDVAAITAVDPSAVVVRNAATALSWMYGTLVVTADAAGFARLVEKAVDFLPGDAARYVDIRVTRKPYTADFVTTYWKAVSERDRVERELEELAPAFEAAVALKQAARFLVLAQATGSAEQFGLGKETLCHVENWARCHDELRARKTRLSRKRSEVSRIPGAMVYDTIRLLHACEYNAR